MKNPRRLVVGAALGSIVATLGTYAYINYDLSSKRKLETESVEETEPIVELPESTEATPYRSEKTQQKAQNLPKYNQKKKSRNQLNHPTQKPSDLERTVEEEKSYDLPPEKRIALTTNWSLENVKDRFEELGKHYQDAMDAHDFKVAASYIPDFQRFMEAEKDTKPEAYQKIENDLAYHITTDYDKYLSAAIEDCSKHDFDSVFAKVTWMNVFLAEHPRLFSPDYLEKSNLANFIRKGNQALEAVEYCN